jgi:hypothetical protein
MGVSAKQTPPQAALGSVTIGHVPVCVVGVGCLCVRTTCGSKLWYLKSQAVHTTI